MHKRKVQNKIPKSFIVAIGVALFFWLLTKLSKEYQTVISFPVEYVNIPQDKLIQSQPLTTIDVQVKATGFRLFAISIVNKRIKLSANKLQRKSNSNFYFLLENQRINIQNQMILKILTYLWINITMTQTLLKNFHPLFFLLLY